jgi:hypothetical protein
MSGYWQLHFVVFFSLSNLQFLLLNTQQLTLHYNISLIHDTNNTKASLIVEESIKYAVRGGCSEQST